MNYNRNNPSSRYIELLEQYKFLHLNGEASRNVPAERTFEGSSTLPQATRVKRLIDLYNAHSLLDYGAGKGRQYEIEIDVEGTKYESLCSYWEIDELYRYDPAYSRFNVLPEKKYDAVVCTDVIEHVPEEDIGWVLNEIFSFAKKFVFANIACYPAKKTLPNGENAHCTTYYKEWWFPFFQDLAHNFSEVKFEVWLHSVEDCPKGRIKTDFKMTNM